MIVEVDYCCGNDFYYRARVQNRLFFSRYNVDWSRRIAAELKDDISRYFKVDRKSITFKHN